MTEIKASNKIYITYKVRMESEAKLRLFSSIANFLIIWFSFCMICASIAEATDAISISYYEVSFASASVAIFASSIFLATGTLDRRANEFRNCYLELQKIWNSSVNEKAKMKRYDSVLARYPNHNSRDHADMIFGAWWNGSKLYDTEARVVYSKLSLLTSAFRKFAFWSFVSLVFLAPILLSPSFVSLTSSGR